MTEGGEMDSGAQRECLSRILELERWQAEHGGRVNEKWRHRDAQDSVDVKRFVSMEKRVGALESNVKLLAARVAWVSMLGGVIAGLAFNLVGKYLMR